MLNQIRATVAQLVNIGDTTEKTRANQISHGIFTETFNVHGVAPDEIQNLPRDNRIFLGDKICRNFVRHGIRRTLIAVDAADARNNFAGLVDANRIADANVHGGDKILVVERSAFDAGAVQQNWVENGGWRNPAGTSDAQLNFAQNGFFFVGRIFVGDSPAREF